jgi:hypothetical protein
MVSVLLSLQKKLEDLIEFMYSLLTSWTSKFCVIGVVWGGGVVGGSNDKGCPMTGGSTMLGCLHVNIVLHFRPLLELL